LKYFPAQDVDKIDSFTHTTDTRFTLMKSEESKPTAGGGHRDIESEIHALLANEQLYRTFFNHLPGMAYLGRPDRQRTMELVSEGQRALLGLFTDGKPFLFAPHIHPDDRDQVLETIAAAVVGHHAYAMEYRVHHTRGAWHTVWEQGHAIRHGNHTVVQGYIMDVHQRLHLEQARRDADHQRLQIQKFNALNKLAGGIAHEINNVIAGMLGSAELMGMDLPADHPCRDSLKQIAECGNRARDFIYKLRSLGQRPRLECRRIRLQPVIEECLQILRNIIPEKVEIHPRLSPDCPRVLADHMQLQQAILDVCLHAWQGMTDRRGQLHLELDVCHLDYANMDSTSLLQPGQHVRLAIRDNGPGMDKTARDRIFDPFHTRRGTGKKMGLEMFLVRETIQAHQGDVFVESEPGKGTACFIYLPPARPE
jgi:PAS domain S-box-containing protein